VVDDLLDCFCLHQTSVQRRRVNRGRRFVNRSTIAIFGMDTKRKPASERASDERPRSTSE
jgi:hypothetical protein